MVTRKIAPHLPKARAMVSPLIIDPSTTDQAFPAIGGLLGYCFGRLLGLEAMRRLRLSPENGLLAKRKRPGRGDPGASVS